MLAELVLKREEKTELNDLHDEAAKLLGYPTDLYKCFNELDIRPFTERSVANYKYYTTEFYKNLDSVLAISCLIAGFAAAAFTVASFVFSIANFFGYCEPQYWPSFASTILWSIVGIGLLGHLWTSKTRHWQQTSFESYQDQMPEYALQTAVDVKKHLPMATICVDRLIISDMVIDPFLVVRYKARDYYVEVWNEPKYKQQRVK